MTQEAQATARASLPTALKPDGNDSIDWERESDDGDKGSLELLKRPKLTWSVDLGSQLKPMTTFELWYALNSGEVSATVRVWRLGREGWTPADEVPELACALRQEKVQLALDTELRKTLEYEAQPPSFGAAPETTMMSAKVALAKNDADEILSPDVPPELAAALVPVPDPEMVSSPASTPTATLEVGAESEPPPVSYVRDLEPNRLRPTSASRASIPAIKSGRSRERGFLGLAAGAIAAAIALVALAPSGSSTKAAHASIAAGVPGGPLTTWGGAAVVAEHDHARDAIALRTLPPREALPDLVMAKTDDSTDDSKAGAAPVVHAPKAQPRRVGPLKTSGASSSAGRSGKPAAASAGKGRAPRSVPVGSGDGGRSRLRRGSK